MTTFPARAGYCRFGDSKIPTGSEAARKSRQFEDVAAQFCRVASAPAPSFSVVIVSYPLAMAALTI
jgi:hypothetical protein